MRILNGWTEKERKELEEAKDTENIGDFLHVITGYPEDTNYGYVRSNYHIASSREQFSIIEDILDFYTGKAKFPEQKYYVQLIKTYTTTIKAEQFDGSTEMIERYHIRTNTVYEPDPEYRSFDDIVPYQIETLEGFIELDPGDWIATGISGEHWPIRNNIFKKTYKEVK